MFTFLCGASKGFMKAFKASQKKCKNEKLSYFLLFARHRDGKG